MKKIMFNDRYGLETAVLNGTKTMTRRIIKGEFEYGGGHSTTVYGPGLKLFSYLSAPCSRPGMNNVCSFQELEPRYKIGEIVAVAQSYKDAGYDEETKVRCKGKWHTIGFTAGWNNKMFVRGDEMPHQIQITDIKVERLQDISEEDCLKEGVEKWIGCYIVPGIMENQGKNNVCFDTPREAFHALITKISGKNVWIDNPLVFAYTFKLIK